MLTVHLFLDESPGIAEALQWNLFRFQANPEVLYHISEFPLHYSELLDQFLVQFNYWRAMVFLLTLLVVTGGTLSFVDLFS